MANNQSFEIHQSSVGTIFDLQAKQTIGTGFVVGSQKLVATCSHVIAHKSNYLYFPIGNEQAYPLVVHNNFPEYDVAFLGFNNDKPVDLRASEFGDIRSIRPGNSIAYFGWESGTNTIKVNQANVLSCGSQLRNDMSIEFIEFIGIAKPGYSGGPVFDFLTGKIVAMIAEGGYYMGYSSSDKALINRAFSIELLKITDKYFRS